MNLYETIEFIIRSNPEYIGENGEILKTKVTEAIMNLDIALVKALKENELTRQVFFKQIDDFWVLNQEELKWVINSKEFLEDSYTSYANEIGLTTGGKFLKSNSDVVLDFPYKDAVLVGGQDKGDQKRQEIMYHEVLGYDQITNLNTPKVLTNARRYTKVGVENNITFDKNDNLIIKGNNYTALNSLLKRYQGQIKLIYLDPPYNTGNDTFGYNDKFNHSTWLTFMKNRLELAWKLLSDDGLLWIQTDDSEVNYLGVLSDEIFGRENYLNTVTIKTKLGGVTGSSAGKSLKDETEFIQIYAKNKENVYLEPINAMTPVWDYIQTEYIEAGKSWKYTSVLLDLGPRKLIKYDEKLDRTYYHYPEAKSTSVKQYAAQYGMTESEVYNKLPDKIFRDTNAQSSVRQDVIEKTEEYQSGFVSIQYTPIKGKNKGKEIEIFYTANKQMVMFLSDMLEKNKQGELLYKEKLGTLWDKIQYNNLSKEGQVNFPNGKKPEKILQNIIEMSTYPDDYVLDFFGGSGTTASVAHKLNRKYISIEQMNDQISFMRERLNNVIAGEDKGISKEVEWKGGGSFVYCELLEDNQRLIEKIQTANTNNIHIIKEEIYNADHIVPYILSSDLEKANESFMDMSLEDQKQVLIELIDKNKLYVNYSSIDDEDYQIQESDRKFSRSFYDGGDISE